MLKKTLINQCRQTKPIGIMILLGVFLIVLSTISVSASFGGTLDTNLTLYYNFSDTAETTGRGAPVYNLTVGLGTPKIVSDGFLGYGTNVSAGNYWNISDGESVLEFGLTHTSLNFWYRQGDVACGASNRIILNKYQGGGVGYYIGECENDFDETELGFAYVCDGDASLIQKGSLYPGDWVMITMVKNASAMEMWVNGTLKNSCARSTPLDATSKSFMIGEQVAVGSQIDEMGWWNRTLTSTEIASLYNNGAGKDYSSGEPMDIQGKLLNPSDGVSTSFSTIFFSANFTPYKRNLTNATLYVWHSNTSIFQLNVSLLSGPFQNSSNISISNFTGGTYYWNYLGCAANETGSSICNWGGSNRSLIKKDYAIVGTSFTPHAYETSFQNFQMNISISGSIQYVSAKLNYNSTEYVATSPCSGGICVISRGIDIPLVPSGTGSQNKSFFWNLTMYDGTISSSFDTSDTLSYQNVTAINLTLCAAAPYNAKALNFTAYHEANRTRMSSFNFEGTFDFWVGTGTVKKSYSHTNVTADEVNFCVMPNQTFYVDANIKYDFEDENNTLTARNHYYQNQSLGGILNHVELFLLNAVDSTSFILQVLKNNAGVANALINIQRYYPGVGLWKTVQIAKTNENGESVGFYEVESVDYRHFIYGSTGALLLQTSSQKVVGKSIPYTLTFDVSVSPSVPWGGFLNQTNYTTSILWNSTSKIVTYNYVDLTDKLLRGRIIVEQIRNSNTSLIVCNLSLVQPSASINCNLSAYTSGTFIAKGYLETASESKFAVSISFLISDAAGILDNSAVIMGWFIILTVGLAFIWNPTVDIIAVNMAVIFVNVIGLVTFAPVWIYGMLGVSILIILLMRT